MTLTPNRTLALLLVVALLTMWAAHAFSNQIVGPDTAQQTPEQSDHGHSHKPLVSHAAVDIEHQHNGHTADHTHDSVQLTPEADHRPSERSGVPRNSVSSVPYPPLDSIKKPPRSLS